MRFIVGRWRRLRYGQPIIVVSGLPRSGTSMMMKMLGAGGVPLLVDDVRLADENNPNGYFEFEAVKALETSGERAWLPAARGKAVKIISWLLTWLPETYNYRVVFMDRDLDEIIASQHAMLGQRGQPGAVDTMDGLGPQAPAGAGPPLARDEIERTREVFAAHLQQTAGFLAKRACFQSLTVNYRHLVEHPAEESSRVATFLNRTLDLDRMAAVADRRLYRNRRQES